MKLKLSLALLLLLPMIIWLPAQAQQPTATLIPGVPTLESPTSLPSMTPALLPTQTATPLNIDAPILEPIFSQEYDQGLNSVAWSPDGSSLAISYGSTILTNIDCCVVTEQTDIWHLPEQKLQVTYSTQMNGSSYPSIFYTTDGQVVVHPTDLGEVQGYDAATGRQLYAINLDEDGPWAPSPALLAYAQDRAIVQSRGGTMTFPINLRTGAKLFATESNHGGFFEIIWSRDGERFFTINYENTLTAHNGRTGVELYNLPYIREIIISPDSRLFLSREEEGTFLRETTTGRLVREVSGFSDWSPDSLSWLVTQNDRAEILSLDGTSNSIPETGTYAFFSPDGHYIIIYNRDTGQTHVWDVSTLTLAFIVPEGAGLRSWSPNGQYAIIGTWTDIFIYETNSWTPVYHLAIELVDTHPYIRNLEWSPNGQMLAVGRVYLDESGQRVEDTKGSTAYVFSMTGMIDTSAVPTPTASSTSTPTIPPTATSTLTPTPTPRLNNILFTDDFSSNALDWETTQMDNTFSNIIDGRYVIDHSAQTSGFGWFIAPGFTDSTLAPQITSDFEYSINVSNITSSTGSYRLTLLIGVQPNYSDYQVINLSLPQGRITLGNAEEFIRLEQQASFIPAEFLASNGGKVSIVVEGTTLTLQLNDQEIYTTQISNLAPGSIGFGVGSISGEKATVHAEFDSLQVLVP